jgi:hypothetical protein
VEYASIDANREDPRSIQRDWMTYGDQELKNLARSNLGPLVAIGDQKATQFFAALASKFDPEALHTYESIFTSWGGDVRERSVDMKKGQVRPRIISVEPDTSGEHRNYGSWNPRESDPTVYARVEYLDENAPITDQGKESCRTILKNLKVVFTYAPMNLLYYQATFPAKSTKTLTVSYKQYAYADTGDPKSYQIAYVVHPASMWKDFGPINLEADTPEGIPLRASIDCIPAGTVEREIRDGRTGDMVKVKCDAHKAILTEKTGELFMAVDGEAWDKATKQVADAKRPKEIIPASPPVAPSAAAPGTVRPAK